MLTMPPLCTGLAVHHILLNIVSFFSPPSILNATHYFYHYLLFTVAEQTDPYYWEEGGDANLDWWGKIRHNLHFGGVKAIAGAESVGEVRKQPICPCIIVLLILRLKAPVLYHYRSNSFHGSRLNPRVGSGRGVYGSGEEVLEISRVGSGSSEVSRVGSFHACQDRRGKSQQHM